MRSFKRNQKRQWELLVIITTRHTTISLTLFKYNRYFYKDASVILMLYDITDAHLFSQIKDYWIEEIKTKTNTNPVCFIVANKSDLFTEEKVPEQDARELAKTIKSGFGMISCKEGSGIKELMEVMMIMYQKIMFPVI